jgi:hypothetical protein
MERIPQSVAYRVALKAYLSTDHVSAATGKTLAVKISKNGGAFGNPNAGATNATEISNGWYYVDLDTTDTGTAGPLLVRATASGVDDVEAQPFSVVNAHHAGFDALPNAAAEASGGLPTLSAAQAANGTINANVHRWLTGTPNALQSGRVDSYLGAVANGVITAASFAANALDAVWSTATRLLTAGTNIVLAKGTGLTGLNDLDAAGVRAAVGLASANLDTQLGNTFARIGAPAGASVSADIAAVKAVDDAVKAKTDNLPSDPADASDISAAFGIVNGNLSTIAGYIDTEVAAIKAKTDNLPANPAAVTDIPTAIENADALLKRDWTAVSGEAARSVLNALRWLRNKWTISAGTLSVMKEDDTTEAWNGAVTNTAADAVSQIDPS